MTKITKILDFIREQLKNSGQEYLVLGLSGGIDSALVLALAVQAVGQDRILAYSMPYFENLETSNNANLLACYYDVNFDTVEIKKIVDAYEYTADSYRIGNIMARTRMTILYDQAMKYKGLVLNTCNLSEDLVGYATKFGDAAGDLAPIAHLTKTEVYQMAEEIGIPEHLINRVPSAELWTAQTDEKELGFTYAELDSVIELFKSNKPESMPMSDMFVWMNSYVGQIPVSPEVYTLIQLKSKSARHKLVPMPNLVY